MTEQEIDALEAGRELDALIAERVLGWTCKTWVDPCNGEQYSHEFYSDNLGRTLASNPKPYSTDIAAAWIVVDYFAEQDWLVKVGNEFDCESEPNTWYCCIALEFAVAITPPLAICKAALKAAMSKEISK